MASAIDATKPADGSAASKSDLRTNLATAKSEIEALQTQIGNPSAYVTAGMRNRLINGAMMIDQRNALAAKSIPAGTTTGLFGPDRWYGASVAGGGVFSMQVFNTGAPAGYSNYLRMAVTTAKGALLAGDFHYVAQAIEGNQWYTMQYGSSTALYSVLTFWVRASIAGTYSVALQNAASANSSVKTYTVSAANTWEYKTISFEGSQIGTWSVGITTGVRVLFDIGSGTTFNALSTNGWTATNKINMAGSVSVIGTNAATFDVTAVQLEPGAVATLYEHRMATLELMMCQRYCAAGTFNIGGVGNLSNQESSNVNINSYLRATPTITRSSESTTNLTSPTAIPTTTGFVLQATPTATGGWLWSGSFKADAEIV
jgi:hypothetical protein